MTTETSMLDLGSNRVKATNGDSHDETLYLSGRPSMRRFVRFMQNESAHPLDEGALAEEWHAAHRHVGVLQEREAGIADNPSFTPLTQLGKQYEPLLIDLLKDPLVRNNFNTVPTDVAMVALDSLVVHQKHIDVTFVRSLKKKLGPMPTEEAIFRTCLPFDHTQPPAKWSRMSRDSFVFVSPSNDLRFLGSLTLEPNQIINHSPPGNTVGMVGLAVGFGSNFLN